MRKVIFEFNLWVILMVMLFPLVSEARPLADVNRDLQSLKGSFKTSIDLKVFDSMNNRISSAILRYGSKGDSGVLGLDITLGCKGQNGQYQTQTWSSWTDAGMLTEVPSMLNWVHSVNCQGSVDVTYR